MKFLMILLFVFNGALAETEEATPAQLKKMAEKELMPLLQNKPIIDSVRAQNAKAMSLKEIKAIDTKWVRTAGYDDFMRKLMANDCTAVLKKAMKRYNYILEAFIVDSQGAVVCMLDKTTDYWQGDEAKFTKAFNNGKGETFIDKVRFDESAQAYTSQISLPIMNDKKVIGVGTFGVNVNLVK
ncbi:MAG: hypothetical protein ACN6I6_00310 [bacterium]